MASYRMPAMQTVATAQQFFLAALEDQAARDSVPLPEIERRMFPMEQAGLRVPDSGFDLLEMVADLAPLAATVLVFAVPFVLLCLDPFHWNLVQSIWLRVLLFVALGTGASLATIAIPDRRHRTRPW